MWYIGNFCPFTGTDLWFPQWAGFGLLLGRCYKIQLSIGFKFTYISSNKILMGTFPKQFPSLETWEFNFFSCVYCCYGHIKCHTEYIIQNHYPLFVDNVIYILDALGRYLIILCPAFVWLLRGAMSFLKNCA